MSKVDLKLDWCSYEAAKYAVEHWHYSKTMPAGKNIYIGVWEDKLFIGAIIFGTGASSSLGSRYGLKWNECSELVRVALNIHKTTVSRIVSISIRLLKSQSPGIRLIISFADPEHGHNGGIYQAGNWVYCGDTSPSTIYELNGKVLHSRNFTSSAWWGYGSKEKPRGAVARKTLSKYRYLYPLDDAMRQQIEPLRKPYPKRTHANEAT